MKKEGYHDINHHGENFGNPSNGESVKISRNGEFGLKEVYLGYGLPPKTDSANMAEDWDDIAPDYVKNYRKRKNTRYEMVEVPELLNRVRHKIPGGKVLDVGSGPLIFAERDVFNSHPKDEWPEEYWGVDPSKEMWKIANNRTDLKPWRERLMKIQAGIEVANLPENYFDLAIASFSLENSPDPIEGIKRVFNSLKSGGIFAGMLKHEDRNRRYLNTLGMDFKMFLKSMNNADSLWAQEYWEGCGEEGAVWALYALNKTWRSWFYEAGFSQVTMISPEIKPEVWKKHKKLAKGWTEQGKSGMIFVARKNNE